MLPLQARVGAVAMKEYSAFPQSSSITRASPTDSLASYRRHSLEGGSYSSEEMQPVYSADWVFYFSF